MIMEGYTGLLIFLDIRNDSVFNRLNFINQASAHLAMVFQDLH